MSHRKMSCLVIEIALGFTEEIYVHARYCFDVRSWPIHSRPITGETFRVQELSDSEHDEHEAVLATPLLSPSPTADLNVASAVMNVGHQRAALELRNLTLEREVRVTALWRDIQKPRRQPSNTRAEAK